MSRPARPGPPLDPAAIDRMALRYVERFATTRARLIRYLERKLAERGCDGPRPDLVALADRFAEQGYIDDRGFGAAKAGTMARRGLGGRRVTEALRHAGLDEDDRAAIAPDIDAQAINSAISFARRKRIGPFAAQPADRDLRQRQIGAMLRAGHRFDLVKKLVAMAPGEDLADLEANTD